MTLPVSMSMIFAVIKRSPKASVTEPTRGQALWRGARLDAWGAQMARIFPDVRDGDHLLGVWRPEGAYFYQGERLIGSIRDAEFARAFFAIWLDPRSSAPGLRAALLEAV